MTTEHSNWLAENLNSLVAIAALVVTGIMAYAGVRNASAAEESAQAAKSSADSARTSLKEWNKQTYLMRSQINEAYGPKLRIEPRWKVDMYNILNKGFVFRNNGRTEAVIESCEIEGLDISEQVRDLPVPAQVEHISGRNSNAPKKPLSEFVDEDMIRELANFIEKEPIFIVKCTYRIPRLPFRCRMVQEMHHRRFMQDATTEVSECVPGREPEVVILDDLRKK